MLVLQSTWQARVPAHTGGRLQCGHDAAGRERAGDPTGEARALALQIHYVRTPTNRSSKVWHKAQGIT